MSDSMRRHKMAWKYAAGLDALSGDDDAIPVVTSAVSEVLKDAGGIIAAKQNQAAAKAAAEKTANDPARKAQEDAVNKAKGARQNATNKATEAEVARLKAQTEADPNGPLHKAAAEAARVAALYDADARGFEMKAGLMPQYSSPMDQKMMAARGSSTATNFLIGGGIILGVGGLAALLYKLLARRAS